LPWGQQKKAPDSVFGKSSKVVIQKHASAFSCQKRADVIGSYEKQEINGSFSQNASYVGFFWYGINSISICEY